MKTLIPFSILVFLLFLTCIPIHAQKSVNRLFNELKKDDHSYALTVPKIFLNYGIKKALQAMNDEDREKFGPLVGNIKKVRILFNEKMNHMDNEVYSKFRREMKNDHFDLYASVRSEGNTVNVFAREKNSLLNDLFFVINGQEGVFLLHLNTTIPVSEFERANFSFSKGESSHLSMAESGGLSQ